jgi:serine/threonine protein kinase
LSLPLCPLVPASLHATTQAKKSVLTCRNVLVGKNNSVKISDFGLSRALAKDDSYYKLSQTLKLPVKWMALECLIYQKFSTYSDGN